MYRTCLFGHTKTKDSKARKPGETSGRRKVIVFNFKGHFIIGVFAGLFLAHNPIYFMAVLIGSFIPDIDHRASFFGRFNMFARFMTHRGHCHSIIGIAVLTAPFMLISPKVYLYAFIGAFFHILGDKLLSFFPRHNKFRVKI